MDNLTTIDITNMNNHSSQDPEVSISKFHKNNFSSIDNNLINYQKQIDLQKEFLVLETRN